MECPGAMLLEGCKKREKGENERERKRVLFLQRVACQSWNTCVGSVDVNVKNGYTCNVCPLSHSGKGSCKHELFA
jgi:hypothetical protein